MLEIGLLGAVNASIDRAPLRMTRPLERALLARLALAGEQPVDAFVLLEDLWTETLDRGLPTLQTLVYRLRRTLGSEGPALIREGSGYLLKVPAAQVDAGRFQELAARGQELYEAGDADQAGRTLQTALELWRGNALADVGDVPFALLHRAGLEEQRLTAIEQWARASLDCGRPQAVIPKLEAALAEQPLREGLWASMMLAHYRSGRQAEALSTFQRLRNLLAEELGVDPTPSVAELHRSILTQDAALDLPSPVHRWSGQAAAPAVLDFPPALDIESSRPFVGRESELERAMSLAGDPDRNRLGVLWILGEPGIGKTRLAAQIARRAHDSGALVLFGRCNEDLSIPYQPFLEAMQWFVARVPENELAGRIGDAPSELARLAPVLAARFPPAPGTSAPELEQHRLFEAVRSWLESAGAGGPVVLVLDDLHWATRPTLALLAHLARSAEPSRTLLVCTARNTLPDRNESLTGLIPQLERLRVPAHHLELGGLPLQAVGELVEALRGRPLNDAAWDGVRRIHGDSAGNPLLLDAWLQATTESSRTLDAAVEERMRTLPQAVAELLDIAAVAGVDFDLRAVAGAAHRSDKETIAALEDARQAGLLHEEDTNRYRFRHALVRDVLRDRLSKSRLVRTHLDLGEALEALHPADPSDYAAELAYHFLKAVPVGGVARAIRYSLLAAGQATQLLSHEQAVEHYERAAELLPQAGAAAEITHGELRLALGEAKRRAGDLRGALESFTSATDQSGTSPANIARAAIAFEDTNYWMGASGHEALDLTSRARASLRAVEEPSLRAVTLAGLSRALVTADRVAEGAERGKEAVELARTLADPATSFAVQFRTTASSTSVREAHSSAEQWMGLSELAPRFGDIDAHLFALSQSLWANAMLGDMATWDHLFAEFSNLAVPQRQPRWESWLECFRGFRALLAADLETAEGHIESSERIGEGFGWAREGLYGVSMYLLRREQGGLDQLLPAVQTLLQIDAGNLWRPGLARLHADLGMLEDARREYEVVLSKGFAGPSAGGNLDLTVGLLAEVCVEIGDSARAPWFFELLRPCEGRLIAFLGCAATLGPADRLLGRLASLAGRPEDANRLLAGARDFAEHLESPLWTAHCLYDHAVLLHSEGHPSAHDMAAEVKTICAEHGLTGLGRRVAELGTLN